MIVKMFQPRFAVLVESGQKKTTIRRLPKIVPSVGDKFSARQWLGLPYRSKQRSLLESEIISIERIRLTIPGGELTAELSGEMLSDFEVDRMAIADGFKNRAEMAAWFGDVHGFPFEGILIRWK